ncbi:MAG: hypothetical protein M3H12_15285 [Chromatiales bacterium]|nr:hypothetical protein [Gammaproteobacteria bacterium]
MEKPKGMKLRGGIWHIDKQINGKPFRFSTKTKDLKVARQVLRDLEFSAGLTPAMTAWEVHVAELMQKKDSWAHQALRSSKRRNKQRGHGQSQLTPHLLKNLLLRSRGYCELTGIPFNYGECAKGSPYRHSIDRINSDTGYSINNCRIICLAANYAINKWGDDVLRKIARALLLKDLQDEFCGETNTITSHKKKTATEAAVSH